jgi:flagellar hook-associated protein 2
MATSIDGLVTGMNTTEIISQLMKIEAIPQTAIKSKVSTQGKAVTAYQSVNTKMASLLTAAKALNADAAWTAMKATSSSDAATVTAGSGASAGSLTFKVNKLAAAHTIIYKDTTVTDLTDAGQPVIAGNTITVLKTDGTPDSLTVTDGAMQTVVNKINETSGLAYRASAVQTSPGRYALQLTATTSGATSPFAVAATEDDADPDPTVHTTTLGPGELTATLGPAHIATLGGDAELTVGTNSTYTITSTTNTFADVLPGLTVTAVKTSSDPVTVSVSADKESVAAKVQALVDTANAALTEISTQSQTKSGNNTVAGPLPGDATLRKLRQDILSAVSGGAGDLGTLSAVGITLDRDGTLEFDKAKFLTAHTADADGTRAYFDSYDDVSSGGHGTAGVWQPGWDTAVGIARKLETIGRYATEGIILPNQPPTTLKEGLLVGVIKRKNAFIETLNDQVAAWDVRLANRQKALQRQYSALEVALSKMQSQSTWLAGQIAGLPSSS